MIGSNFEMLVSLVLIPKYECSPSNLYHGEKESQSTREVDFVHATVTYIEN